MEMSVPFCLRELYDRMEAFELEPVKRDYKKLLSIFV